MVAKLLRESMQKVQGRKKIQKRKEWQVKKLKPTKSEQVLPFFRKILRIFGRGGTFSTKYGRMGRPLEVGFVRKRNSHGRSR